MKYAVEMGSGAMIYIPSFIKIGSAIQKLIGVDTQTAWKSHKPTFIFSKYGMYAENGRVCRKYDENSSHDWERFSDKCY
jgi:hypothetical protein